MTNINSKTKIGNKMSYFLLFILLAFSGNPVFNQNKFFLIIFGVVLILLTIFFNKTKFDVVFKKRLFEYVSFFSLIFLLQSIFLDYLSIEGVINFCFKILVGAIIVHLLDYNFREKYLNLMYFLGVISIVGFLINLTGIKIPAIFEVNNNSTIILFGTLNSMFDAPPMRNSGMFWEPGAYAGYLLLIPILYIRDLKELWTWHKKKCIILLIALLTTLSTTGYIIIYLIFIYYLMIKSGKKFLVYLSLPFIMSGMYTIFTQLDFLGEKIETQSESSFSNTVGQDFSPDRFGALAFDLYYIEKHPIFGNGLHSKTRYADHQYLVKDEESGILSHGNGFSNFIASMGVISILFYFYLIYRRFPFAKRDSFFVILLIVLLLQGEQFLDYPLFLALPFILIHKKNEFEFIKNSRSPYLS